LDESVPTYDTFPVLDIFDNALPITNLENILPQELLYSIPFDESPNPFAEQEVLLINSEFLMNH
jgi:hypothetical protein